MSTLEMRLRQGLGATALAIAADPASKSRVVARGQRKRNVRRAIGGLALTSIVALGALAMPRFDELVETRIAPAGGGKTFDGSIDGHAFDATLPRGWEAVVEAEAGVVFRPVAGPGGVALFTPGGLEDPRATFGYDSPGPLILSSWARNLPLEEPAIAKVQLHGSEATRISGSTGAPALAIGELIGGYDLELPARGSVLLFVLEHEPVVVVGWGRGPGFETATDLISTLTFAGAGR